MTEGPVVRATQAVLIAFILGAVAFVGLLFLRATLIDPVRPGGDGDCFRSSSSTMTCIMP